MELKLTINILEEGDNAFTAWINEIRGVIAQGNSIEDAKNELFKVLKIRFELERKERMMKNSEHVTTEEFNLIPA